MIKNDTFERSEESNWVGEAEDGAKLRGVASKGAYLYIYPQLGQAGGKAILLNALPRYFCRAAPLDRRFDARFASRPDAGAALPRGLS